VHEILVKFLCSVFSIPHFIVTLNFGSVECTCMYVCMHVCHLVTILWSKKPQIQEQQNSAKSCLERHIVHLSTGNAHTFIQYNFSLQYRPVNICMKYNSTGFFTQAFWLLRKCVFISY